jgi:hypothetical protein
MLEGAFGTLDGDYCFFFGGEAVIYRYFLFFYLRNSVIISLSSSWHNELTNIPYKIGFYANLYNILMIANINKPAPGRMAN